MEKAAQALMRASLHDLANVLSGIRGILDLCPAGRPLSARDRDRLDTVITDGLGILERSRHLAMDTLPSRDLEPGDPWRATLQQQLHPLGIMFRCDIHIACEGNPDPDQWPGELLRGYVHGLVRQVLPYIQTGACTILCGADQREWRLRISPATAVPERLLPGHEGQLQDIPVRWTLRVGSELGIVLTCDQGAILVRVPRTT